MSEGPKTLIYAAVALVVTLTAYLWRTTDSPVLIETGDQTILFPDFKDPLQAKSLEITSYDEKLDKFQRIVVEQQKDGSWTIPTHHNYPADAETQLRDAATALVDLRSVGVATDLEDEHQLFGVKAPDKDKVKLGEEGVGLQIRMLDAKGQSLASLVIGLEDRANKEQRFVRLPNQSRVHVVKIDPKKLSTKFSDWIEKDLLQLNAFDVNRVRLRDYSVSRSDRGFRLSDRLDATMGFDTTANAWNMQEMKTFQRGMPVPTQLAENEELNKEKLDALKQALDELQIADVHPKPKGLRADLKADAGFMNEREGLESLVQRGFYPLAAPDSNDVELYSANGEVHVATKDGVEYLLRFGNIAGAEEGSEEGKLNRFLFVTTRVDLSQFQPPELEAEPADVPTSEAKPDAPAEKPAPKACADDQAQDSTQHEKPADAKPEAGKPADEKPADEKPADEKPADEKPASQKPVTEEKPAATEKPTDVRKPAAKKADAADERERIKKDNQRKMDEYNERRKKAEAKVTELNARFADWYYVIAEDTYKKIHLGRVDVVREKTSTADEGTGIEAFRKLQEGIDAPATPAAPPPGPPGGGRPGLPPGFGLPPG